MPSRAYEAFVLSGVLILKNFINGGNIGYILEKLALFSKEFPKTMEEVVL